MSALRMKLVEKAEAIIRESVRPMERIEGIKILHVDGLGGGGGDGGDGDGGTAAASPTAWSTRRCASAPRRRSSTSCCARSASRAATSSAWSAAPAARRPRCRRRRAEGIAGDPRLRLERHRRQRRHRLVAHPRLQRPAAMASRHRRQPDRERRAERPGRLHPPLPHSRRRHDPRAPAGALGLRLHAASTRSSRARWASRTTSPRSSSRR